MKQIEVTIQKLISSGLDPQLENNPYLCFVYTSFQVRVGCGDLFVFHEHLHVPPITRFHS